MTLEEIREKFIPIWKQIKDFVPMASKEEGERVKRKGLRLEQESAKKMKISEEVSEEDLKEMMQLVPVEEVYMEALQLKKEKEGLDSKLIGFESASKDLDTLLGSQRTNKNKEGLGYSVVPPPSCSRKYWPKKNFAHKNVTPRADLLKTASISTAKRVNTAAPRPNVNSARPKTTQDLVIIKLIQRVKRLERELKARTPPIKIQKVNVRGRSRSVLAWVPKKLVQKNSTAELPLLIEDQINVNIKAD
nr:hypothetical protein [Tanacetum cinerariifolium]